jgi:hypothetical protein
MLGRIDPQLSLLDTGSLLEGLVDEDSFYGKLAEHGRSLVGDEEFADCYAVGWGRPSIPPSTLMLACLLAVHDGTSDRQTAQQVRLNLGWKAALGVPIDHPGSIRPPSASSVPGSCCTKRTSSCSARSWPGRWRRECCPPQPAADRLLAEATGIGTRTETLVDPPDLTV